MGKKILGFVLFLSMAGFIMLLTIRSGHREVSELPKELRKKEYFKLYFFNTLLLLVNLLFWWSITLLWR